MAGWAKPQLTPTTAGQSSWFFDGSSFTRASKAFAIIAKLIPSRLDKAAEKEATHIAILLNRAAPSQKRYDERFPDKLDESFYAQRYGPGVWAVYTKAPYKHLWVTYGTKRHPILPRAKKALWWPGIRGDRPVASVNHPGIRRKNRYAQIAIDDYFKSGMKSGPAGTRGSFFQFGSEIITGLVVLAGNVMVTAVGIPASIISGMVNWATGNTGSTSSRSGGASSSKGEKDSSFSEFGGDNR